MCNRSWIYVLPLTVLFALLATTSQAQEAIGKATSVRPQAEGSHAGPLSGGSNVYSKETVRTGDSGQADLQFHDRSNLTVGPKSSVRLDKFVYDPNKSGGAVAIQATRGTFRFVTGSQGGSYQIKSPYGTLGIRG
ncbi:MAG: FecR domain-containing protein [Pseudolabrys sp.]